MEPEDSIYAGIEVGGIVRSRDGGATWEQLGGTDPDIHTIHISESQPETIYTATANGPYRSDDGGESWLLVNSGLANRYSVPVSAAPEDHRRVTGVGIGQRGPKVGGTGLSLDGCGGKLVTAGHRRR